jgi:hypothetical protein
MQAGSHAHKLLVSRDNFLTCLKKRDLKNLPAFGENLFDQSDASTDCVNDGSGTAVRPRCVYWRLHSTPEPLHDGDSSIHNLAAKVHGPKMLIGEEVDFAIFRIDRGIHTESRPANLRGD